jgi:hypothetical protein
VADFFYYLQVILNVFKRTVIRQLAEQRFHFLFCSDHGSVHSTPDASRLPKRELRCWRSLTGRVLLLDA